MQYLHGAAYTFVAIAILTSVGNIACRLLFEYAGLNSKSESKKTQAQPAGWIIGWLERLILAIGIIINSWEVLAAVIALKTVARFKELDNQSFAEYFLVGSLFSILWAVLISSFWLAYDREIGVDLRTQILNFKQIKPIEQKICHKPILRYPTLELKELCE